MKYNKLNNKKNIINFHGKYSRLLALVDDLRGFAIRGLPRMVSNKDGLFIHQIVKNGNRLDKKGLNCRYTSIVFIGLSGEDKEVIDSIFGCSLIQAYQPLYDQIETMTNMGDIALALWAASAINYQNRDDIINKVIGLYSKKEKFQTVELSWLLDALCLLKNSNYDYYINEIANHIISSFNPKSRLFPHIINSGRFNLRSHVSCFADLVYPVHALSNYFKYSNKIKALNVAKQCAEQICRLQGENGQWWWHYDYRTGHLLDRYPVYSVHQHAMAPMALLVLEEAGGGSYLEAIDKGMLWMNCAAEVNNSLIDSEYDLIWRKVGRYEPKKLSRFIQIASSAVVDDLRMPGLDKIFPPTRIDYETRPYEIGWLLYAWNKERVNKIEMLK